MRLRLSLAVVVVSVAGCTDPEQLAPPFAGNWASSTMGCGGPRITINKSGIAAAGMPVDGLTFTSANVSGATAHVVMELSSAARLIANTPPAGRPYDRDDMRNIEILATLIASGRSISASNVIFRDRKTRQLRAADRDVLAVMSLRRCDDRDGQRSYGSAGASRAGQQAARTP